MFFSGLAATELASAILRKCDEPISKSELASDLFGLCGYDMLHEVSDIILHRADLLEAYEVMLNICNFFKRFYTLQSQIKDWQLCIFNCL